VARKKSFETFKPDEHPERDEEVDDAEERH
jgi:hypothetical protein